MRRVFFEELVLEHVINILTIKAINVKCNAHVDCHLFWPLMLISELNNNLRLRLNCSIHR